MLKEKAFEIGKDLNLPVIERQKQPIRKLLTGREGLLLVYETKLVLVNANGTKLEFHPDTAMLRIKSPHDALLSLLGNNPLQILDTTMGLASDSIVMASAGHDVTAIESNPIIHFLVSQGLANYISGNQGLDKAMRSIKTYCSQSLRFMKKLSDKSFDVIYLDPMFSEGIKESENLDGIRPLANFQRLTDEFLDEAKRIARAKIIIKAHYRDTVFEEFGFERLRRPNQKCHYGVIDLLI